MTEFWKSNPRHFCDFCKCWIADNKPSKDFHEQGKRHKENVEKKITSLRKKGVKDAQAKQDMSDFLKEMERGAKKAMEKDIKKNPSLAAQYGVEIPEETVPVMSCEPPPANYQSKAATVPFSREAPAYAPPAYSESSASESDAANSSTREYASVPSASWSEAKSDEGYTYYWNCITGETTWVKPDGYKPAGTESAVQEISEVARERNSYKESTIGHFAADVEPTTGEAVENTQNSESEQTNQENDDSSDEPSMPARSSEAVSTSDIPLPPFGEVDKSGEVDTPEEAVQPSYAELSRPPIMNKKSAYGTWETVAAPVAPPPVDLQLPSDESKHVEVKKVVVTEAKIKFREKKIDTLGAEFVAFKKRKVASQGNTRGRKMRPKNND